MNDPVGFNSVKLLKNTSSHLGKNLSYLGKRHTPSRDIYNAKAEEGGHAEKSNYCGLGEEVNVTCR